VIRAPILRSPVHKSDTEPKKRSWPHVSRYSPPQERYSCDNYKQEPKAPSCSCPSSITILCESCVIQPSIVRCGKGRAQAPSGQRMATPRISSAAMNPPPGAAGQHVAEEALLAVMKFSMWREGKAFLKRRCSSNSVRARLAQLSVKTMRRKSAGTCAIAKIASR